MRTLFFILICFLIVQSSGPASAQPLVPKDLPASKVSPPSTGFQFAVPCCEMSSWKLAAEDGPNARTLAALAHDGARGEMLLFGGVDSAGLDRGETWSWNGAFWAQLPVAGPSPRRAAAMVHDAARNRVVLFGGLGGTTSLGDTWEWDGSAWHQIPVTGPSPRHGAMMAYDSDRKVTVLFGGVGETMSVLWEWNGSAWTSVPVPLGNPLVRSYGGLVYDSARKKLVLFGGRQGSGGGFPSLGDTWERSADGTWAFFGGTAPAARHGFSMIYESGCGRIVLVGGLRGDDPVPNDDTWQRQGTTWSFIAKQGSPSVSVAGPGERTAHAMAYWPGMDQTVLYGGVPRFAAHPKPHKDTWQWGCPCDDEAAVLDNKGEVILPPDYDPSRPVVVEDVDMPRGYVDGIYRGFDTTTDNWIDDYPCDFDIGGTVPPEAENPDVRGELLAEGVDADPQEIVDTLAEFQDYIGINEIVFKTNGLPTAPPVSPGYSPPLTPYCPDPSDDHYLGGRDIVFIHGLNIASLLGKMAGDPGASSTWPQDREEFYKNLGGTGHYGWWKQRADSVWNRHINHFFRDRGRKNRYLIVAWPSTQRLEDGIRCVMEQIDLAMRTGQGVINPSDPTCTQKFGTPSYVIVSHSAGSLLTDAMLAAAVKDTNLDAQHIARYCKAHISLHGATSGSEYATPVVALSGLVTLPSSPEWLCPLTRLVLSKYSGIPVSSITCDDIGELTDSVLVDLVPSVAQLKWGVPYIARGTVRAVSVTGGHPSAMRPLKFLLQAGYDDGVTNANSQAMGGHTVTLSAPPFTATRFVPNYYFYWPSGFIPMPLWPSFISIYHMGVESERANGLYIDQRFWHFFHRNRVAGGPSPNKSPLGKVQKMSRFLTGLLYRSMHADNRYPLHYAYLFSPSDHFADVDMAMHGYVGNGYPPTEGHENWEETVCITDNDKGIFDPFAMPYPGDDEPILKRANLPRQIDFVRGKSIPVPRLFGRPSRRIWLWRRHFFILEDAQSKVECDYVYERLLTDGAGCQRCPNWCQCPADIDGNCVLDGTDQDLFNTYFFLGDIRADMNGDGIIDAQDQTLFDELFANGCKKRRKTGDTMDSGPPSPI